MTIRTMSLAGNVLIATRAAVAAPSTAAVPPKPNIVFILADDLGFGDVGCYNPESKVPTPNLDRLAQEGMRFTDAHSPATVCTPSRYSLLTGRMSFRTGMRGVFTGVDGPCMIEEDRLTLPQMLRDKGYATAMSGKWHVGMTFLTKDGEPAYSLKLPARQAAAASADWREPGREVARVQSVDFSKPIPDGPVNRGFDQFFGTACCPTTDWLYAYIDGDRVPVPPRTLLDRTPLPKHAYAHDNRRGLIAPGFDLEEVDLVFLEKSKQFLKRHVKANRDKPFFLYHAMQAVHLPSLSADRFKGSTAAGPHGDFIFELDFVVGELMKTLDELGVTDNTLVMFGSDNGPEVTSVINMRADHGHDGARPWRGVKRDQWEGGHRTPFIVRWPGKVQPGSTTDQTFSLTDVMATCAAIVGSDLPEEAAEDSYNFLPVLLGNQGDTPVRRYTLEQTISNALSIRYGQWKYLDHKGSGGNNYSGGPLKEYALPDTEPEAPGQLYDLATDPGETENLYSAHPEIVQQLKAQLEAFKTSGRSAPSRTRKKRKE